MESMIESLEPRRLMALFTVMNLNDAGAGSLRQAVLDANASIGIADAIEFDASLQQGTLALASPITISDDLTITGRGGALTKISGNHATSAFDIAPSTNVFLSDLTITDGVGAVAGAIVNAGSLTLARVVLSENSTPAGQAGAIFNSGVLSITESLFRDNSTVSGGAGALTSTGTLTITRGVEGNSTFSNNTAANAGAGAILIAAGTANIAGTSFGNNSSGTGGGGAVVNNATASFVTASFWYNTAVDGGAILNTATLVIDQGDFQNNSASNFGGAIVNQGSLTIGNSTFGDTHLTGYNHATRGGAIYNAGPLTIGGSQIRNNFITGEDHLGDGGAIYATGGADIVIGSTRIWNNTAQRGGGIFAADDAGTIAITGSDVAGNTAETGGGIYAGLRLTITTTEINTNRAARGAGIYRAGDGATLNISASTMWANAATDGGGAIFIAGISTLNVVNSTIAQNIASDSGAGIFTGAGALVFVDNSTIVFNRAGTAGAGFYNYGTTRLRSTIVANNTIDNTTTGSDIAGPTPLDAGSSFNLIGDSATAGGLVDGSDHNIVGEDPLLSVPNEHGGPTLNYVLLAGSPAIDAGGNPLNLPFDQRGSGFPRAFHGVADIGAIETVFPPTVRLNTTPDFVYYGSDQDITLNANASDTDGSVVRVDFYHDIDNDGELEPDELLGSDTDGADGYQFIFTQTPTLVMGYNWFYAVATDDDGLWNQAADGFMVLNNPPVAGTLTPSEPSLAQGDPLTLTASGFLDPDGTNLVVRFYLDRNANGFGDANELLGTDSTPEDGFTFTVAGDFMTTLAPGEHTFLASALDEHGDVSNPAGAAVTVLYSLRAGEYEVVGTADANDTSYVAAVTPAGDVIVFDEGWTATNLTLTTDCPKATGNPRIWFDSNDGLIYVAATSGEGLILFRRASDGSWTSRNLTSETQGDPPTSGIPTHALTVLIGATDGTVVIAAITAANNIIAYRQTDSDDAGPVFTFVNITFDLASQGMITPQLDSLISYVPAWDAWHLAGIDANGRIPSIWINENVEGFTKWRLDDLTAITGAPTLTGQLAVTLTSWGGINLTGLSAEGDLLTTWWVPEFGADWQVNNLTEDFDGPRLVDGRLTGYSTAWNGLNYVGLDDEGTVTVYWWAPGVEDWTVEPLLPPSVPAADRPAGSLTSFASPEGTLNVFGASEGGDVIRMWWRPDGAPDWAAENLTELATRE